MPDPNAPWQAPWYNQGLPTNQPQYQPAPAPAPAPTSGNNIWNTLTLGTNNPANNPWGYAPTLPQAPQYMTYAPPPLPTPGSWNPSMSSMTGAPLTPNSTGLPYPAVPPSTNWGNPDTAQWEAGMNSINAGQNALNAKTAYTNMQPLKWTADGRVLDARTGQLQATSAQIAEQTRNNQARMAEDQAITAAQHDPNNIIAVARAQRERDNSDYTYRIAGLSTPVDVKMPPGFNGTMPPGVRKRLQTIAEQLTDVQADNEKMRKYHEEAARLITAERGTEVTAAEIASGRVSLTLDQAEHAMRVAELGVSQAQLSAAAVKQPPAPGLAWDEKGQAWVNASDLQTIQQQREATASALAPVSLDNLMALLNADKISATDFRDEVQRKYHYLDSTVDQLLNLAAIRKSQSANGINFGGFGAQVSTQGIAPPNQQQPGQPAQQQPSGPTTMYNSDGTPYNPAGHVVGGIFGR